MALDCRGHCAVVEVGRADGRESGDANSPAGRETGTVRSPVTGSQYSLHPLCVRQGLLLLKPGHRGFQAQLSMLGRCLPVRFLSRGSTGHPGKCWLGDLRLRAGTSLCSALLELAFRSPHPTAPLLPLAKSSRSGVGLGQAATSSFQAGNVISSGPWGPWGPWVFKLKLGQMLL